MNKPLVTIITPAYNCEKYIAQTIDSVLDNGYENIEYIVIDDGSSDSILDILAGYEYGEPRFTAFAHLNMGEQRTVNKALAMVKGEYFMIVNADDPLMPGAINVLVAFMECHPDVICAYPDWHSINEDGTLRSEFISREYDFAYMVKHHTCLPSVGSILRSSILKNPAIRRDESYRWLGDFSFWLNVGLTGPMKRVPMPLAYWRHRDGQASGDKSDARAQEHIRIMGEFYSRLDIPPEILKVKREAICWSYIVATAVTDSKLKWLCYVVKGFLSHPLIMFSVEFWDTLIKRAIHILRR